MQAHEWSAESPEKLKRTSRPPPHHATSNPAPNSRGQMSELSALILCFFLRFFEPALLESDGLLEVSGRSRKSTP